MGQRRAGARDFQGSLLIITPFPCYEGISRVYFGWIWELFGSVSRAVSKRGKRPRRIFTYSTIHSPKQLSNPQLLHCRVWLIISFKPKLPEKVHCLLDSHGIVITIHCSIITGPVLVNYYLYKCHKCYCKRKKQFNF